MSEPPGEKGPTRGADGRQARSRLGGYLGRLRDPAELSRRARQRAKDALRRQVPSGARHAFRVDLTASLLAGLYIGAVFPFVAVIARDDLGASPELLALMTAAPFLGNLLALFWARAMEGRRKVPFVTWSHLGARLMILLAFFATGAWPFALVTSLAQVIGTIATPAYVSVIRDVYPDDQRGRLLSYTRAAILAAMIASTLAAGWAMARIGAGGYRLVFPAAAFVGMAAALIFARIHPAEAAVPEAEREPAAPLWKRVRETARFIGDTLGILRVDLAYRWFALSVFTYGFGNLLTVPIIPLVQVDELHITKAQLAVLVNLMQVVAILGYFYWGRYVDQRSPQRAVVLSILINCLVPLVYILTGLFSSPNAWMLLPAYVVSGVVLAGIDLSYFNAILTFAGPDNVSRYQALQSFLLGVRGSVAPFIGSGLVALLRAHHLNLRWAFALGIVFMLAGAWMQVVAMRRQEARQAGAS